MGKVAVSVRHTSNVIDDNTNCYFISFLVLLRQ
jgi:hypothetical protein